jgi:hypothetical protein
MADSKHTPAAAGGMSWASDLFEEAVEASADAAPLDPRDFGHEAATEAWSARAPSDPADPIAGGWAPMPRALAGEGPEDSAEELPTQPTLLGMDAPPEELDLGLPLGSGPASRGGPPQEIGAGSGILGLPLGGGARAVPKVSPTLPCTILVVGSDRAAAAQTAAILMGTGYTCRVALPEAAAAVLGAERVDVVLLDLPAELARAADPVTLSRAFGGYAGPAIITSSGPLPALQQPGWRALGKPLSEGPLVAAVEAVRDERGPPAPAPRSAPRPLIRPESMAGAALFELTDNLVRALLVSAQGASRRGRVRSMSHQGHVVVEIRDPLAVGAEVEVEVILVDGVRGAFRGRVNRRAEDQMLVELKLEPAQVPLLTRFVDEARDITQPTIEQVRVRELPRAGAPLDVPDDRALLALFERATQALDDDAQQQAFIQACIKAQRLELAVSCYRELKVSRPDDARVAKYLNQVGTILGFYAFRNKDAEVQEPGMPKTLKWALVAFVVASLSLWVLVTVLS